MLYWAKCEAIGLRVLRHLISPTFHNVGLVDALMSISITRFNKYRDAESDALLCKTFDVEEVTELGVFGELHSKYLENGKMTESKSAVSADELNPARCTILMYCYE